MNRATVSILLAVVLLAAGLLCPCPSMTPPAAASTTSRASTDAHACCSSGAGAVDSESGAPSGDPLDPSPTCPHCTGNLERLAPGANDRIEKPAAVATVAAGLDWLSPRFLAAPVVLDVATDVHHARADLRSASPPDRCALACTFLN